MVADTSIAHLDPDDQQVRPSARLRVVSDPPPMAGADDVGPALEHARTLAAAGVPLFLAAPAIAHGAWDQRGGTGGTGYRLPSDWQHTLIDRSGAVIDQWRPSMALCAVGGHGLDFFDVDPRSGGEESYNGLRAADSLPRRYGRQSTPSGGWHDLVASLDAGSRDGFAPGLDLKGGRLDGTSRGFIFLAPTRKLSKVTGEVGCYTWQEPPDPAAADGDTSGEALAALINAARQRTPERPAPLTPAESVELDDAERARLDAWVSAAVAGVQAELRACHDWPEGRTERRATAGGTTEDRGWQKLTADAAFRLGAIGRAPWCPWTHDRLRAAYLEAVPRGGGADRRWAQSIWASQYPRATVAALPAARAPEGRTLDLVPGEAGTVDPATGELVETVDLRELFWTERPSLAHLRRFAYARTVGPWALLGAVLVRVTACCPPNVVLPATVGSHGSLNLFVGLVGRSGDGKGAAIGAAADAITIGAAPETFNAGSGEGLGHLFAHREKGEVIQDRTAVILNVPEVDTLAALGARQGATLLPQLRSAWSGEELGFAYADPSKRLPIRPHTYRLCLTVGIQPGRAGGLLQDSDGGTPQRFVWLPAADPHHELQAPAEPEPLPVLLAWPNAAGRVVIDVCQVARDTIRAAQVARARGEGDALDGHALLCRLKVAAALALLEGRYNVDDDDWRLAGVVMAVSTDTRESVARHLRAESEAANTARAQAEGVRAAISEDVAARQAVQRVARRLRALLDKGGEMPRADLRRGLASRDRQHFEDALELLETAGQVAVSGTEHGARVALAG